MRKLLGMLGIVVALGGVLSLVGCVSGALAESNERAVTALAQAACNNDETCMPVAQDAVDNAAAITEASGTLPQLFNFGIPADLVEKNTENVDVLAGKVDPDKPDDVAKADKAKKTAAKLKGKARPADPFLDAAQTNPWAAGIANAIELIGGAIGVFYGMTRGRKHISNWWKTPSGQDAPGAIPPVTPETIAVANTPPADTLAATGTPPTI